MPVDTTYEEDVKIDENNLTEEWIKQPALMAKWSAKYALAVKQRARAEENVKVVKAEVKRAIELETAKVVKYIRQFPQDYGLSVDPSQKAIESVIPRDLDLQEFIDQKNKEVKQAVDEYLDLVEEEEVYGAAVKAMGHRKKALENLASLFLANYYGDCKLPRDAQDARRVRAENIGRQMQHERSTRRRDAGDD